MRKEAFFLPILEPIGSEYVKPVGPIEVAETQEAVATRIEMLSSVQVALVTIRLNFEQAGGESSYRVLADASVRYYVEHLRPLVRKTDSVFLQKHVFYFVLVGANMQGGEIVQERLWGALLWHNNNTFDDGYLRPSRITIGYSACTAPFMNIYECIEAACEVKREFDVRPTKVAGGTNRIKEAELSEIARKLGVPYVALLPRKLPVSVRRLVDPRLARELQCFPIGREHDVLTVAMVDPRDRNVLERLRKETGLKIFPVLTHPQELQAALEQFS